MSILIKISFLAAFVLGALMAVINYVHYGLVQGVIAFVFFWFIGLLGGALLAKIMISLNQQAVSDLPFAGKGKYQGVNQQRNIVLLISYDQALEKSLEAIKLVKGYKYHKNTGNEIIAKTRCGWKSFGEKIVLLIKPISASEIEVQITSKPRLFTTLIDYGKNCENVEIIKHALMKR